MDALRTMINNPFKENFNRKKKKVFNFFTVFLFFIKAMSKFS